MQIILYSDVSGVLLRSEKHYQQNIQNLKIKLTKKSHYYGVNVRYGSQTVVQKL